MVEAIRPVSEIHVPQVHTGGAGSGVPPYLGGEGGVSGVPGSGMAALEQGPVESQGTFNYDLLNQGTFASQAPQRPESMGSQSSVDFNKLPNISMSYTGYLMAMRNLPPTPGQKFAREGVELLAKKAGIDAFKNFGGPQLVNAIVPGAFYTSFNPFASAGGAALRNLVGTKTATGTLMPKGLGAFGNPQSASKLVPTTTLSKTIGSAAFYAQVGYDIFKFADDPSAASGGALVGGAIGYYIGGPFGYAVGSFLGSTVGGFFGGGSKRYRRERLQFSMDSTAHGKSAFNAQRVQTATGGDNTTVVAVIEDTAYYHQGSGRYSQPITLPITTGNPQGFLDLEHRSAQELVQGLIGQAIDSGTGFGSAGHFLHTPPSASLGARTIDMFLRKMGKTDKADEFKEEVFKHEGNFYDSQPNIVPHTLDRDFNFLGEDTLKNSHNTGASIQLFDNRFGITQDVIYGKAVAGRSGIEAQGEMYPTLGGQGSMVLQR